MRRYFARSGIVGDDEGRVDESGFVRLLEEVSNCKA
jgi:hypothetical protein